MSEIIDKERRRVHRAKCEKQARSMAVVSFHSLPDAHAGTCPRLKRGRHTWQGFKEYLLVCLGQTEGAPICPSWMGKMGQQYSVHHACNSVLCSQVDSVLHTHNYSIHVNVCHTVLCFDATRPHQTTPDRTRPDLASQAMSRPAAWCHSGPLREPGNCDRIPCHQSASLTCSESRIHRYL